MEEAERPLVRTRESTLAEDFDSDSTSSGVARTPPPPPRGGPAGSPGAPAGEPRAALQVQSWPLLQQGLARSRNFWRRIRELAENGILIQAVGVPTRHLLGLWGLTLCLRGRVGWRTGLLAFSLWPLSGFGVTAGAHRLWAHQSFKATPVMEALLVVLFSLADQGSIQGWTLTHAMHHSSSDTDMDPHNRKAGFWHSHFGWIYSAQRFHLPRSQYFRVMNGLGPIPRFHDRVFLLWDPCWSMAVPALIASLWGEAVNGLLVAGALRWMFVQHVTFFVNSVAHGPRDGADDAYLMDASAHDIGPRVSLLTTILALGEGWHDYHHMFPWDYAAAELGSLDQWNPTKMFIDLCGNLGLVTDRRRSSTHMQLTQRAKLVEEAGMPPVAEYKVEGFPFLRCRMPVRSGDQPPKQDPNGLRRRQAF